MTDNKMTYRQYLQFHANNHQSENKRKEAQALLNVVGDDGNIDGNFLTGERVDRGWFRSPDMREKQSNGFTASAVNRTLNPWWNESYKKYSAQWDKDAGVGLHGPSLDPTRGQSGGSSMTYDPKAVAWLDQQLARFPGLYRNIENNRQNRLKRNAEDYELYRQDAEDQYGLAKRNFEFEKSQRLKTREKRLAGNDASYKNQMDQWQRYLGMMGVGRSSTAQVTVPEALSREATQAKDQIEDENALNATKSQLSWDETERRRSRTLADLINNKNRADDETNAQFDGLMAGQKEKEAQLQRERGQAQGRTIGSILNSTQPLINEADRLNAQASTYGSQRTMVKPDINVKYDAINPDKFRLDRNQNNVNTDLMAGDPNNDMTRNVEEEKKKRYRTLGSLVGA